MKFFLTLLVAALFPVMVMAEDENCENCGSPQAYTPVACELVALHFVQAQHGVVAIRLYDAEGAIIYDRYAKERAFVKRVRDTYAICKSTVAKAAKVTITRCTPEVATPMTYEGNVLRAFIESAAHPVRLP